jgi:hypothetical protein
MISKQASWGGETWTYDLGCRIPLSWHYPASFHVSERI